MANEIRPPNRPGLRFLVFISLFAGFLLQAVAFGFLFTGLCDNVPDNRTYCQVDNETLNDGDETNDLPDGESFHTGYHFFVGAAVFKELFAVMKASCKIFCCVKHICVPLCADTWECCSCCGHCWFIMSGISVFLNIVGTIPICMTVPFSDMINYIIGFRLSFGNVLFGFLKIHNKTYHNKCFKLTVWTVYSIYRKSCCPDSAYFLCSNRRLSECKIETTEVTNEWTETTHADGTVTRSNERETGRRSLGTRKVRTACILM